MAKKIKHFAVTAKNQVSFRGLAVWIVCCLFFLYECLLRTALGTFQQDLSSELHLTPVTFALLSSTAYNLVCCIMQIPVGIITARYGLKKTLFLAVLACSLANLGFAWAPGFREAITFRALMGFGASFGFVCLLIAVYDWMPHKNIALFIGLSQFIGTLGPMLAAGPLSSVAELSAVSWREVFTCFAIAGFIIAFFVLLIVDRKKCDQRFITLTRPSSFMHIFVNLFSQKQIWAIAIFSASIFFSLEYLSENECKNFLIQKGLPPHYSAYMITVAWIGFAFACAFFGFVSDTIKRRKTPMMICAISALSGMIGILYLPLNAWETAICFLLLGIGASGQSIGFATMAEQCKADHLTYGLGFNNAMLIIFSAMNAPLIGILLTKFSQYAPSPLAAYQNAFIIMLLMIIISVILSGWIVQETFCKSTQQSTLLTRPTSPNNL